MVSLEALVRNYNVIGISRMLSSGGSMEELEKIMNEMGIPITFESKRDLLLRSLEQWRRTELSKEHFGNNRPKPLAEMLKGRRWLTVGRT